MDKYEQFKEWYKTVNVNGNAAHKLWNQQYPNDTLSRKKVREYVKAFKKQIASEPPTQLSLTEQYANKIAKVTQDLAEAESEDKLKIKFLEAQSKILKNQNQKLLEDKALDSEIVRLFQNTIEKFDYSVPQIIKNHISDDKPKEEVVALLSDIHYGEVIDSESMLDSNSYSPAIAKERLNTWLNNFFSIMSNFSKGYQHQKVNLFLLGDMVSGLIHDELKSGTCEVDQVIELAEILSQAIKAISEEFPEVVVSGVIGNHGRLKQKPYAKKKYNNFDYLVYKFIEARCQNLENVSFAFPKSGMLIQTIKGHNFLLRHGECKANGYAGIPHYGISRASSKLTQLIACLKDMFIHYECLGHFHTSNTIEKVGGAIIMNGTTKGGDEFALDYLHTTAEPKQTLFGVHEVYGKTWSMDISCK